ncbi:ubiquinone biosynthesis accessory factor UbiJ [Massilia sp. S19_KUP03_FR1]|uniref:ubiquinone biosynthesis accessory factor UbiJ n=1 Tax=Massilia sp. S19_KUP03_FR1 TaxID=3025503 RepID=UPI002FCD8BAF
MSSTPSPSSLFPPRLIMPVVAAINHLLAQEAWARVTLGLHAGKEALIDTGAVQLRMRVTRDGMVEPGSDETPATVTIRVKLSDLPLILQNRERAFSYVKIEGDAEFANTISQLSKGLRWEAEHDLEKLFGPIAATRLAEGARTAATGVAATGKKFAENVAEYLLEERAVLIRPSQVSDMADDITRLRDDVERAAKRLEKLEARLALRSVSPPTRNLDS